MCVTEVVGRKWSRDVRGRWSRDVCGRLCEGELGGGGRVEVCVCVCACERGISWSSCACNKTTQYSTHTSSLFH